MRVVEPILTRNPCFTAGKKITVKGLMLHSVGCPQPNASAFIRSWNNENHDSSCVHGFIDGNDGVVYQTLPWNHRGWHAGGSANNTHIGVEMCEPDCIRYTGGSSFVCSDTEKARTVARRTYQTAVELFAMLCAEFSLNPLAEGVVISHREGCARGVASNHGDPEHLWTQLGLSYTMDGFRKDVKSAMKESAKTAIMGTAVATAKQMEKYLLSVNPSAKVYAELAEVFLSEGQAEGVRGDIAFAQSLLETGNFTFRGDVKAAQNNFAGLGATGGGVAGNSFATPVLGIRSQIQHLKAYASTEGLSNECVDVRFQYVERGCAEYVEWLGQKENPKGKGWAAGAGYGEKILVILSKILSMKADEPKEVWYRVRKAWEDAATQKGAFHSLENAKKCAEENKGYSVFDEDGRVVFSNNVFVPYPVRVSIENLNIRKDPGTNYGKTGSYTGKGVFTIVEEAEGEGAGLWGLLKSYQKNRDGWISLDYAERV